MRWMLIAAAGLAVVAAVVVAVVMVRGGDDVAGGEGDGDEEDVVAEVAVRGQVAGADDDEEAEVGAAVPERNGPEPAALAAALQRELTSRRLWATAEVEAGDERALAIRSAYCEEDGVSEVLAELSASLQQAGVSRVRCYARHGALVFERAP